MEKPDRTLITARIDTNIYTEFKIKAVRERKPMGVLLEELMRKAVA
ncbi:MAG: hypothetical protein KAJ08_15335 [Deltaproteobacteria bacterium]|nr:hypothetical protein [Deltaproteobacteria bacterium]